MAEPIPSITCGCGFTVTGMNEDWSVDALDRHECPWQPPQLPRPPRVPYTWHESVFSVWGLLIVGVIAYALTVVFGGVPW